MARYESDFEGIPGGFAAPTGMDPNFWHGYHGMRMRANPGQAAYGAYRFTHSDDLETVGGFDGIYRPFALGQTDLERNGSPGGIRDPFTDDRFLRDFDSRGQRFAADDEPRASDRGLPLPRSRDRERLNGTEGYDPSYANRGMPPAGYGEGWARGPMRGAR